MVDTSPGSASSHRPRTRDLFGVTFWLPGPPQLETREALFRDGMIVPGGSKRIELTGQEFLLLRGLDRDEAVARFASRFGLLGLWRSLEDVGAHPARWPVWARALSDPREDHTGENGEPVLDWKRQAGLMDLAVGLDGLRRNVAARTALLDASRELLEAPRDERLDLQRRLGSEQASWESRSTLVGAADAGLMATLDDLGGLADPKISFSAPSWRVVQTEAGPATFSVRMGLSEQEVSEFLVYRLVNPWVARRTAALKVESSEIHPAERWQPDLLGNLWLQFANALVSDRAPKLCSWERCPGPPERPKVFFWRWGPTTTGIKHKDAAYCHTLCMRAAVSDRSRKSAGAKQKAKRLKRAAGSTDAG
jgi:hypothetical protein